MRIGVFVLMVCVPLSMLGQIGQDTIAIDNRYLEDQFYAGITYNFLFNLPTDVSQRNFSYGLQAGFIKDIPLNQKRNVGLGVGLGLGLNSYYTNIRASELGGDIVYSIPADGVSTKLSKIETHLVEFPLEFRWRNSNATEYNFWRIYTGVKFSYLINARSKFYGERATGESINENFDNNDLQKLHYGLTFNFGYHNFNIHVYYALTGLFNEQVYLGAELLKIKPLQVGFVFYIL